MTGELVNWPSCNGDGYEDSGEGGMFAYACWPADTNDPRVSSRTADDCHVDVWASLSQPDACVTYGAAREAVYANHSTGVQAPADDGIESEAWAAFEHRTYCAEASVPLRAAALLGSTSVSAYGAIGEYFSVQRRHLTPAGLAVIEALERAYGAPALLLTFLDT